MPKNRYSEEEAVQKPAGELLSSLGWDVCYCFDEEVLGADGTLRRSFEFFVESKRLSVFTDDMNV